MRHIILSALFVGLCTLNTQIQGYALQQEESEAREDSTSSILGGLYGTYPLLDKAQLEQLAKKEEQNRHDLKRIEAERTQRLESLNVLMDSDTISIRRHSKFLGGLFTYPKLTEQEKQGVEIRKKITDEKEAIAKLEEKITELKEKQKEMKALKKKHDQYLEKRILWGFIVWEVKKKGKQ